MGAQSAGRGWWGSGATATAFAATDVVFPGVRKKYFVSWRACLGDMGAMESRHLRYFIAAAEAGRSMGRGIEVAGGQIDKAGQLPIGESGF